MVSDYAQSLKHKSKHLSFWCFACVSFFRKNTVFLKNLFKIVSLIQNMKLTLLLWVLPLIFHLKGTISLTLS